jgi:beta-lactamase class A
MQIRSRICPIVLAALLSIGSCAAAGTSALSKTVATPIPEASQEHELQVLLDSCDAVFGVIIIDPEDQIVFEKNADLPFVSASLYKLVLLAEVLDRIELGELTLEQKVPISSDYYLIANGDDSYFAYEAIGTSVTIEELVYSAGAYSSNVGAQALMSLTSPERLDAFARKLGLTETHYWVEAGEVREHYATTGDAKASTDYVQSMEFVESAAGDDVINVTTPRDMATFFRLLRDDRLVSPLVSWRIKQVLSARVINDRIPALLPASAESIHKTGNLDGVIHDTGIVETPSGPVVVIAMAQAAMDIDMTYLVEQRLGLFGYQLGSARVRSSPPEATPVTP